MTQVLSDPEFPISHSSLQHSPVQLYPGPLVGLVGLRRALTLSLLPELD